MMVPSILVSGQQTQVTATVFVAGATPNTQVQLFNLAGGTPVLVGNMTDDGQNGDQTAGDQVYTIVTTIAAPAAASLPMRVVASPGTSANFSVQVLQIPSYTTNTDVNQAETQIYNTAIQTRTALSSPDWSNQGLVQGVCGDLTSIFGAFSGVVNQNPALRSALLESRRESVRAHTADTATGTAEDALTSGLLSPAQNATSCNQLVGSLGDLRGQPGYPTPLDPSDPQLKEFANELAGLCPSNPQCQSLAPITADDLIGNGNPAAVEWAREYMVTGPSLPTPIDGCGGGVTQSLASVAVKSELKQFTDMAGNGIASLANLGQIGMQAVGSVADYMLGWFVDSSGNQGITVAQTAPTETFATPTGTYNATVSFGGDTANATITKTPVYPNSITNISPLPGIILWLDPPEIQSFSPTSGPVGTPITLSGYGFNPPSGSLTSINFNGVNATVSSATDSSMTVVVPPGATSGPITVVTTVGETMSSISFTVTASPGTPPAAITVSPLTAKVFVGGHQAFAATVTGLSNTAVTWSVNGSIGGDTTVGTISSTGSDTALYTAPATVPSPTTVTVIATSQADASVSGSASVTIEPSGAVTVSPASVALAEGGTQQFTAAVSGGGTVNWTVAGGSADGTITSAGLYTAPNTTGTFRVVATNAADTSQSFTATVTVTAPSSSPNEWTWMSGSNTGGALAVFGTPGVPAVGNVPGARAAASSWTDSSGNFWLFGGGGNDVSNNGNGGANNNLWEYNRASGMWAWISGSGASESLGNWGTQGIPAPSNVPGERDDAVSWTDSSGNFWLFGGGGTDSTRTSDQLLNDLWEFNPTTKVWTWVSGASTGDQAGVYGTQGTPASTNVPGARSDAVSWIDSNGNLWLFGGYGSDSVGNSGYLNDLWVFNPTSKVWTWVSGSSTLEPLVYYNSYGQPGIYGTQGIPSTSNVPCGREFAVSWIDGSGNLWLFGGDGNDSTTGGWGALNDLWEFNPTTKAWTWVSGANAVNQTGVYGTQGSPGNTNVPGARAAAASWIDSSGNLWLFGGASYPSWGNLAPLFNDLWKFNPTTKTWTWVSGASTANQPGTYGTQGTPASTNVPGARSAAVGWIDGSGTLWLFGGNGYDSNGTSEYLLNDLWRYQP
jgi:hypothetical protein